MALNDEQLEDLARQVFAAQRGDWPADITEARRMVRLATAQGEAVELLVAIRVMELCAEAEERNAGRL